MRAFLIIIFLLIVVAGQAQQSTFFKRIDFRIDTAEYQYPEDSRVYKNEKTLFFKAENKDEIMEITLFPEEGVKIKHLHIVGSADYMVLDSLKEIGNKYFRGKLRLLSLPDIKFLRLVLIAETDVGLITDEIKMSPFFETFVGGPSETQDLYIGEDRTIELSAKNIFNIRIPSDWQVAGPLKFRLQKGDNNTIKLLVHPESLGAKDLILNLKTVAPFLKENNELTYNLPPVKLKFNIKPSRIGYVNLDRNEFFLDPASLQTEEVQVDFHRNFEIGKTYRIENQQKPGGRLVAELYTVSVVGNSNKILAVLRPYTLHKISEGYLFIKDGDELEFITNFNVLERPNVENISVLREGQDWTSSTVVYPGERVEVKIEGRGLSKADFYFDGVKDIRYDTTRTSDNVKFYLIKIPTDIIKRRISLYMNGTITKFDLQLREYQIPKALGFVGLSYDKEVFPLSGNVFNKPVLTRAPIKDINIMFFENNIDTKTRFYGKQYLTIEVRIYNTKSDLIEFQKIDNVVVCPGEASPRYFFYDVKDCKKGEININDYLLHKTYDMEGWWKLEITIKHNDQKYSLPGYSQKITFIKEMVTALDLQVSFPTGLLVKKFSQSGFGNLTGISIAFLAQFSFYDQQKVGKLKPYKVGAGFIALDIFNLSDNNKQRDLGFVVLGSLFPVRKESKFSFPLYAGCGYLLKNNTFFVVFGPGVTFNF